MCSDKLEISEFNLEQIICEVISITNVDAMNRNIKLLYNIDGRLNVNIFTDSNKLRYVILNAVQYVISTSVNSAAIDLNVIVEKQNSTNITVRFEIKNSSSREEISGKLINAASGVPSIEDELINSNDLVKKMGGGKLNITYGKNPDNIVISFVLDFFKGGFITLIKPNEIGTALSEEFDGIKPCKVLLVEDNTSNAQLTIELLTQFYNHDVTWVENGLLAVEAVQKERYDAILMDIQMPVMDGFEASRKIRDKGNNTPIIALTAAIMPWSYDECINSGMDAFISKPAGVKKLGLMIKNTIEKRKFINTQQHSSSITDPSENKK